MIFQNQKIVNLYLLIDVRIEKIMIELSMNDYAKGLGMIEVRNVNPHDELTRVSLKIYRKYTAY